MENINKNPEQKHVSQSLFGATFLAILASLHFHTRGLLELLQKDIRLKAFFNEIESSGSQGSSCGC